MQVVVPARVCLRSLLHECKQFQWCARVSLSVVHDMLGCFVVWRHTRCMCGCEFHCATVLDMLEPFDMGSRCYWKSLGIVCNVENSCGGVRIIIVAVCG